MQPQQQSPFTNQQFTISKKEKTDDIGEYVFPDPYVKYKIMPAEEDKKALDVTTIDDPDK